ncbi:RNA-directed DNA polymerase, eukaryota, reverse transcriptase zinc-binding domain protein [Tanacetum coccineum]
MGDFNEVRTSSERFGSNFNQVGAKLFNEFIANAGLVEIPHGGCSYTWCHKSTNKMSKLDRFLISESLFSTCAGMSSVALDRYLSDHRPILMRESDQDYGPTPFKFYHYWFEYPGFDAFVEKSWKETCNSDSNDYVRFLKKLKLMKERIKFWVKSYKESVNGQKNTLKRELQQLDSVIDKGCGGANEVQCMQDVVEGDENSKYYHGVINKKRSKLSIRGVLVDGIWIESPLLVKNAFFEHFKNQFDEPGLSDVILEREFTNKVSSAQVEELERDVSREEVKRAVWDCGVEKSPGPDGFTFGFYRRYWNLIEEDVFKAVVWFFHHGMIPAGGSVYKVIAKILANRLVTVLEDIVSESQSAFVKDRQILDGPLILNELVQWCKKAKQQSMFFKVDFEKAYDSVSLHASFQRVVDAGLFSGIRLDNSTCISHLFYADDAIFMGQWKSSNIENITRVLDIFHKASGLRINMAKSKLLGVSVDHNRVDQAVRRIGCTVLKMPFNYLGSQVGSLMSRTMSWNEVLERMTNRLSRWKLKTISIGGRLTLLKSILGSTPLYHMSMFRVPKQVLQQMERIRARFFNGTDIKSKKISWVSWKRTMASRDTGGKKVCVSYPSAWLNIVKEMGVMQAKGIDILNYMKLKCGDGTSTSFWKDIWRDEVAFKDLYPRLYMLENMKEVTVAHKLAQEDLEWSFRRKVRSGCEMQQLNSLKAKIEGVILNNSSDRWTWSLEGSGEFSVSSLRKEIDSVYLPQSGKKTRWIKQVPIKVNILAWKVSNDYLPTRVNLSKRGMEIESILCPMCNLSAESACHLFFQCETSRQIFNKICRWWELEIQAINSYEEWVVWMVNIRLRSNSKSAFEAGLDAPVSETKLVMKILR